tara:strand:- start:3460 stop:4566 length:1107 start_codon:yes stop_codon:yes gene_type:complete
MKIIFNTKQLLDKVKNIAPTAEAKQTLILLGNMVMKVDQNKATLTSSDLEIEVTSSINCDSEGDCEFSLPARKLLEILNALTEHEEVTFKISESKVDITAGKSKISLPTLPSAEFPYMESMSLEDMKTISNNELTQIINKTSFAMAYQDARHFLNGLHICSQDGKIVSVCTDGHRLAKYQSEADCDQELSLIVPRKAILEINRILNYFSGNSENLIKYSYNSKNFMVQINDFNINSKLIEGSYPNFNKVIPESTSSEIIVDKKTLKTSLNIISKVVNQQYKGVKLTPQKDTMHLISSNTDSEIGEDQIDVVYNGDDISIGFNISYLQDVIDVIDGDSIHICVNDQNSGCLLKGSNDPNSTFVIMPMRV